MEIKSSLLRYAVAMLATALALVIRFLLMPILGNDAPLLVFLLAVMITARYAGPGPGLLALFLSALAGVFFFVLPAYSFEIVRSRDMIRLIQFILIGLLVMWLMEALRAARQRGEASARAQRESEERFRLLVEGVRDYALFLLDAGGRAVSWNPGVERVLGYKEEEIIGQPISRIFSPEDVAQGAPEQELETAEREGRALDERWHVRKDGSRFFATGVIYPLRDEAGNLRGFAKVVQDITERKRAEEEVKRLNRDLKQRVDEQQTLLDVAPAGIAVAQDPQCRQITANRWLSELLKVPPGHNVSKGAPAGEQPPYRVYREGREVPPEELPLQQAALHRTEVRDFDMQIILGDEETPRQLVGHAKPLLDEQGNVRGAVGAFMDITERKRAEEAVRESEARKGAILEAALDGIISIDHEGRIIEFNPAAERVFGYRREEALGREIAELIVPPSLREAHRCGLAQYLATGEGPVIGKRIEVTGMRADGTEFPVELSITRIAVDGPPLFTGYLRDITERKRAEEELIRRARQQAAVAELGQRALAGADLRALMEEAVALVAQSLEVEYSKVLELLPQGDALLLRAGVGWKQGLVGHGTVSAGTDSQAGYTLLSEEPVIVEDLRAETRFGGPPLLHEHGVVSSMSVIIHGPGGEAKRPFGVLGAHTTRRRRFTQDDINFLQAAANVLATAIARHRAQEALRESEARLRGLIDSSIVGMLLSDFGGDIVDANDAFLRMVGYTREDLLSGQMRWDEMTPPEYRHLSDQAVEQLRTSGVCTPFEKEYIRKDGSRVPVLAGAALLKGSQQNGVAYVVDITERKRAEHVLRGRTTALTRMLKALTARPDLETFLGQVVATVAELSQSRWVCLWLCDEAEDTWLPNIAYDHGRIRTKEHPDFWAAAGSRLSDDVMARTRQPLVVENIAQDPRLTDREWLLSRGIQTLLLTPLLLGDEVIGALSICSTDKRRYRPEEIELAQALAQQATLAVQMTRLAEQGQQAAVLAERNRMAREIHDTLAQGFTGILVQLEAAQYELTKAPEKARGHLVRARDQARESLIEARRSVRALHPRALERSGLPDALTHHIGQMTQGAPVRAEFHVRGSPRPLPPDTENNLLRIGLEALTNALKHARASAIGVELCFGPEQVRLSVRDDGQGFEPHLAVTSDGFGLTGMRERAEGMGGRLTITSRPGRGTEVAVAVSTADLSTKGSLS